MQLNTLYLNYLNFNHIFLFHYSLLLNIKNYLVFSDLIFIHFYLIDDYNYVDLSMNSWNKLFNDKNFCY